MSHVTALQHKQERFFCIVFGVKMKAGLWPADRFIKPEGAGNEILAVSSDFYPYC